MSLEGILAILTERGLSIRVSLDGKPSLLGPKEEVTDILREAVVAYRDEIVERFRPKPPRRIVLLNADGKIEKVLEECEGKGHHERLRERAKDYPGRTIAGEWRQLYDCKESWMRFVVLRVPARTTRKKPVLSHETAAHVYRYLADFADYYPELCESDKAMYRDLARAALLSIDNEERAEEMLVGRGIDTVLFRVCRGDVGTRLLRQLREAGIRVRLAAGTIFLGPKDRINDAVRRRVESWKAAIRDALLSELLSEGLKNVD